MCNDDPAALAATLAAKVRVGDRLSLARAVTWVENETPAAHPLLAVLYPHGGHSHIIGVTGAPGTGKSTLVAALARQYRVAEQTVAVVAIDPTSPFTGGAILGDRVRMRGLSGDPGIFVRSMATRGSLGGLSKTTSDVITVLDAAGFDRILVETVGVGQAEVEIAGAAHTTLVVEAPGFGDEIQAIKAGILEIGDLLVVNKADRPGADKTVQALEMMLELDANGPRPLRHHGRLFTMPTATTDADVWPVRVFKTVAGTGEGVAELHAAIEAHLAWLNASGEMAVREQLRSARTLENILLAELNRRAAARLPDVTALVDAVRRREQDPYTAAQTLLGAW